MKLHIITVGKPKLAYAQAGWSEYIGRLEHSFTLRVTHLADKYANDDAKITATAGSAFVVVLEITGKQLSSPQLADFLRAHELEGREVAFIIGGPDGLPDEVRSSANMQLSFSALTFPHDLAMVMLLEALYRAASINAGTPYHK